jgi:aspartate/methionine/tyrosine aminotransferase
MTSKVKQADRMKRIHLSGIRKVFEKVGELERKGAKITHMEIGRPDFDTPSHIKEAAKKALDEGFVHYTASVGIPELRKAIAGKLSRDNGIRIDPDRELIVTLGANQAIFLCMMGLLNPGDEVLVPEPMFVYYADWGEFAGAKTVSVPLREEENFRVRAEDIERCITPRSRMLILNSPHNPTGAVLNRDTLAAIAEVTKRFDLLVLSDEIYEKMVYDGAKHFSIATFPGMRDRTLTVNGFSKSFSMTGWRLGYVACNPDLMGALLKVHQHTVVCPVSFAQKGATAALTGPQDCVNKIVREFDRRRKLVMDCLSEIGGVKVIRPQGAFYIFPSIKETGRSSQEIADYLLEEAGVAVVPGSAFGSLGEGYIRIAYSTSYDDLEEGLSRMKAALAKLCS